MVLGNWARLGRMDHIFKEMGNIRETQIRQARPGALTMRIVRRETFRPLDEEEEVLRETRKPVGDNTDVAVEYVDASPREANRKLRVAVANLAGS